MSKAQIKTKSANSKKVLGKKDTLSLTDQATKLVRDRIIDLTLEPGMTLDERQILEKFQLGRTPMREALNRLIAEGLVVSRGQRGAQVAPLNISTAVELFDAYVICERMVASMLHFTDPGLVEDLTAIQSIYVQSLNPTDLARVTEVNEMFHKRLAEATQNSFVVGHSAKLHRLARRLSFYIFRREATNDNRAPVLFDNPRKGHDNIIEHIRLHDRKMLVEELTDHAIFFRTRLGRIVTEDRSREIDFTGLATQF